MFDSGHFGAPSPVLGAPDEAGPDRVHADVVERAVPVILVADHPGSKALAEQGSLASVDNVVLAGIGAVQAVERAGEVLSAT